MMTTIQQTKARIRELEVEVERLPQQPALFAQFSDVRESALIQNMRSLRSQRRKLARLEGKGV